MNLFGGLGKAVKGVGKVVETAGHVATGVVDGAGKTVAAVGEKVVETVGHAATGVVDGAGKTIEAVGDAMTGKKKPKKGLKDIIVEQINEDFRDDMKNDDADFEEEMKQYEKELDRQMRDADEQEVDFSNPYVLKPVPLEEEVDFSNDPEIDEAEQKLLKIERGGAAEEESDDEEETQNIIPKHFSLKSFHNNKYLRYTNEGQNSDGLLRFSSKNIVGPYSKFAVRASKNHPGFVHIRSCYNNKFWVRLSADDKRIAAIADEEQEDDVSKPSCTLFHPFFVPERNGFYIRHIQLDKYLSLDERDCLVASVGAENVEQIDEKTFLFSAVDWDSIFVLPKYVAFKANNGQFLEPSGKYLKFSASSVEDSAVVFEVVAMEDGYIRIKHVKSGKYWRRDPNWIWCASIDTKRSDPNTLFWPVKVDNSIVALRSKANNQFCKRLTADGKTDCLNAAVSTITESARFEVSEVVIDRSIENVEYRVEDSRVYGKKILSVSKGVAINKTEVEDRVTLKFRYEKKVERMWSSSVSMTFGMAAKYKTKIPTVGSMKFELSMEASKEKTREESEKEKSFEEMSETITIGPMSKVKFGAVVSQGCCDVPFSYTQRDTLRDGTQVTHRFEDGIFTGVTTYDYKFETERLALWDGENWSKTIESSAGAVEEDDESSESD